MVASLGTVRKDKPDAIVTARVLYDRTDGLTINRQLSRKNPRSPSTPTSVRRIVKDPFTLQIGICLDAECIQSQTSSQILLERSALHRCLRTGLELLCACACACARACLFLCYCLMLLLPLRCGGGGRGWRRQTETVTTDSLRSVAQDC